MKYFTPVFMLVLTVFFSTSCVSDINNSKLNINIDNIQQSEMLKLINSNDDITLYKLGSQIMEKSGFLNKNEQGYGYYAIALKNSKDSAPNKLIIGLLNGLTVFTLSLIGIPTDLQEFDITAYLYIFDSTGTMIKVYKNANTFRKLSGLYYGQDPDIKASKYYSILFKGILEQINIQYEEINYLLRKTGPITIENTQPARMKITEFFRLNKI